MVSENKTNPKERCEPSNHQEFLFLPSPTSNSRCSNVNILRCGYRIHQQVLIKLVYKASELRFISVYRSPLRTLYVYHGKCSKPNVSDGAGRIRRWVSQRSHVRSKPAKTSLRCPFQFFMNRKIEAAIRLCDRSLQMHEMGAVKAFRDKVIRAQDGIKELRDATREDLEVGNM